MLAAFLLVPVLVIGQESRDLLSAKKIALQTIPGSPFGGSGGAPFNPSGDIIFSGIDTFTGTVNYGGTTSAFHSCSWNTTQTPDTFVCGVGTTGRSYVIVENGDTGFDFAHALQTNPTLFIHSSAQSTTQYVALFHDGTNPRIDSGTGAVRIIQNAEVNGYWSGTSAGSAGGLFYPTVTAFTPDGPSFSTGTTANAYHINENGDVAFDFNNGPCGTAACTNPTLIVQDKDQNTTNYVATAVYGHAGGFRTTLTESSATTAIQIPIAASVGTGGRLDYCVHANDATDFQERCAFVRFAGVNKAATETCGMTNNAGTADASITELEDGNASAISAGTLTYAITCSTASANALDLQINAVSSLTQTTLEVRGMITLTGPGEPLP